MYERFEQLLTTRGETAYKVGKATGISSTTFSEWKHGRSTPKPDKLKKIADHFDVPISYFYDDEDIVTAYQIDMTIKRMAENLRADQIDILKSIASLSSDEVRAVDMFIKSLKGKIVP